MELKRSFEENCSMDIFDSSCQQGTPSSFRECRGLMSTFHLYICVTNLPSIATEQDLSKELLPEGLPLKYRKGSFEATPLRQS